MIHDLVSPLSRAPNETRVAVLVDGENISQVSADAILGVAARLGVSGFRRVYGNLQKLKDWSVDPRFAAIHTGTTPSKNCADITIVIDAMDIAHSGKANTFLIASSDSDFAPLALRLNEGGFRVVGMGRETASQRFREACSEFISLPEPIRPTEAEMPASAGSQPSRPADKAQEQKLDRIDTAIHEVCRAHGGSAARLSLIQLGNLLPKEKKVQRRETGYGTWQKYLKSMQDLYLLEGSGNDKTVRLKRP